MYFCEMKVTGNITHLLMIEYKPAADKRLTSIHVHARQQFDISIKGG